MTIYSGNFFFVILEILELKCIVYISGVNKKQLVSEEEFRKCFANPYAYGQHGSN